MATSDQPPAASPPGHPGVRARVIDGALPVPAVEGLDPASAPGPDAVAAWLRELLWWYGVVCIRLDAPLDDATFRAIASMPGAIKELLARDRDGTEIRYGETKQIIDAGFVMTSELAEALGDVSFGGDDVRPGLFTAFHTDDSYVARPAAVTVLHARQLPTGGGGDTCFLDMRAAYASLTPDEQASLTGLRAVHAYDNHDAFPPRPSATGDLAVLEDVAHPVVRAHPVRGTAALYFDLDRACHIDGMDVDEGRRLLQRLQDEAEATAPRYCHAWQPHDVLIWDNASVQHRASGDFEVGEPRRFWRLMVEGPVPAAFTP
jgi:alpha-ketoglutarate-dependent taurine dioxygenase